MGCVKFKKKISTILSINSIFFKLETQKSNVRSTKNSFKNIKKSKKNSLGPDAFLDKQC